MSYVQDLERELADARAAATPVTSEVIESNAERVVTRDSRGTTRVDHLGGESVQYYEPPRAPVELKPSEKAVPKEVGDVIDQDSGGRNIKLVSGTIRRDCW